MEIWFKSVHIEMINRLIASQPQSRVQVVEVPYEQNGPQSAIDFGELIITVIKGNGIIKTKDEKFNIGQNDQVHLVAGDFFALQAAQKDKKFVVQIYWSPSNLELFH